MNNNSQILAFVRNQLTQAQTLLSSLTLDTQGRELPHRDLYDKLEAHIDGFLSAGSEPRWLAIAGLRGVGKTTLLAQLYTTSKIAESRKLYISLDRASDLGFGLSDILAAYEELLGSSFEQLETPFFLFLDEVQYQPTWARTVKTLFDRSRNVFVITTGSSAVALQTNPDIDRRMILEKLYPFGFGEYIHAKLQKSMPEGLSNRLRTVLFSSNTAQEVYDGLRKESDSVTDFWTGIERFEIDRYLKFGSLPFALNLSNEQLIYQQIQRLVENIIAKDVTQLNAFDKPTLNKIGQLLYAIAGADTVSVSKLAATLEIDPKTVTQVLDTLEKTEMLLRVYPHGAHYGQVKKPSKYLFTSSTYRAMYYNMVGSIEQYDQYKGRLLEDVVGVSLFHQFSRLPGASIAYDSAASGADFVLSSSMNGEKIIIEVGMGKKGFEQVVNTLQKTGGKYGLIVSQSGLSVRDDGRCVSVPLEYFLLIT